MRYSVGQMRLYTPQLTYTIAPTVHIYRSQSKK